MRILIVGAGGIGGYFGGRLAEKGADVTFLVRAQRQQQLAKGGLVIRSFHGDYTGPVQTIRSGQKAEAFDLVLLAVKAYHLEQVLHDLHPYVSDGTVILPLLNGYTHITTLQARFGAERVLGGTCFIETTLDKAGHIIQTSQRHDLVFGEWDGSMSQRVKTIQQHLQPANFNISLSPHVQQAIWHKYIFITAMSGITTFMRAPVGPILDNPHGKTTCKRLINEIVTIAHHIGAPVAPDISQQTFTAMEAVHYDMKSSMQRDMEKQLPVEADHLQGEWLSMAAKHGVDAENYPILQAVYGHLKVYEATRA